MLNEKQKFLYWHKAQKSKLPEGAYTHIAKLNGNNLLEEDYIKIQELSGRGVSVAALSKVYVVYPSVIRFILKEL